MQLGYFLDQSTKTLHSAGIGTARLDVLVLLEDVLGSPRAHLLAHPEQTITLPQLSLLNKKVIQRMSHTPLAYIRGRAAFFGRDFTVNKHVLVPRPETEAMIELLKSLPLPARPRIIDVGTGSGCIGISAALEIPGSQVTMTDIDPKALATAQQNARAYNVPANLRIQDLLASSGRFDVVLANLPYVPSGYAINQAAHHEPKLALFAGPDGLDLYRTLWPQIGELKPLYAFTEALEGQHKAIAGLAQEAGYKLRAAQGLVQLFTLQEQPQA